MPVTLREVAERAGVSRAAVSRTFTEGASVSARTRAKVEKAAAELGFSPNLLARGLTTRRTDLIGLVSNNFRNPVFLQVFDLFTRSIQERGLRPLIFNLQGEAGAAETITQLKQYSVDGVIIASSHVPDGFADAFRDAGLPVVHAFGRASAAPQVHVVGIDNAAAGRMAAATLVERGYTRLGFLGGPQHASTTQDRLSGFAAAAAERGLDVQADFAGAYSFEAGRAAMTRLLRAARAEAWFCADDVLSIGALSAISEAGSKVPADVGIIGLNDMEMSGWANISLTTIHQPFDAIVQASIDLVLASRSDPELAAQVRLFPCRVVERGTLRPAPLAKSP